MCIILLIISSAAGLGCRTMSQSEISLNTPFFSIQDSISSIEARLAAALKSVEWIGGLPITKSDFELLARIIRGLNVAQPSRIPHRTLVTSMVFCARYAEFGDDERPNFWTKYQEMVWKRSNDTNFQTSLRERFREARDLLQTEYGFDFPTKATSTQDVVSGIYLHAILPTYLQDDFAKFFAHQYARPSSWRDITETSDADVGAILGTIEQFPLGISKRFKVFVHNEEMRPTAVRLLKSIAQAALWYSEGTNDESVRTSLISLEVDIWDQLRPMLDETLRERSAQSPRKTRSHLDWAWYYEENDILEVRVKNLPLSGQSHPDRVVWLPDTELANVNLGEKVPDYGHRYVEIGAPLKTRNGYEVDHAVLVDVGQSALVVAVDEHDIALCEPQRTAHLPAGDAALFHIPSNGSLAVLESESRLHDGRYAVTFDQESTRLTNMDGNPLQPIETLVVPRILAEQHGHSFAAIYDLSLPILINDRRIDKRAERQAPSIGGERPVAGLVAGTLPVFESGEVWLELTLPNDVAHERVKLEIAVNESSSQTIRLSDLHDYVEAVPDTSDRFHIQLARRFPEARLLQVNVYYGTRQAAPYPLAVGILPPGVSVQTSELSQFYTIYHLPSIRITGVSLRDISCGQTASLNSEGDNEVTLQYADPRHDVTLRLCFDSLYIPLTFDVKWAHGYVEPVVGDQLWEEALEESVLNVRGAPRQPFTIKVGDATREYALNARGLYNCLIKDDALTDILRKYVGAKIPVTLCFPNTQPIPLFTYVRVQYEDLEHFPEAIQRAVRALRRLTGVGRRSGTVAQTAEMAAIPKRYLDMVPAESLPSPLQEIVRIHGNTEVPDINELLPEKRFQLRLVDDSTYPLERSEKDSSGSDWVIWIERETSEGNHLVQVHLQHGDTEVLVGGRTELRQCEECGALYWNNEPRAKVFHGHGRPLPRGRDVSRKPIIGWVERRASELQELREVTFDIGRYMPAKVRDTHLQAYRTQASPLRNMFTSEEYRGATHEWLDNRESNLAAILTDESDTFAKNVLERLRNSREPALVALSSLVFTAKRLHGRSASPDPMVLTLAAISRAYANGFVNLLTDKEFETFLSLLNIAHTRFRRLLTWALCWAELFLIHTWEIDSNEPNSAD